MNGRISLPGPVPGPVPLPPGPVPFPPPGPWYGVINFALHTFLRYIPVLPVFSKQLSASCSLSQLTPRQGEGIMKDIVLDMSQSEMQVARLGVVLRSRSSSVNSRSQPIWYRLPMGEVKTVLSA